MLTFLKHWSQAFIVWCAILGAILFLGRAVDWLFTRFGAMRAWGLIGLPVSVGYAAVCVLLDRRRMIR